MSAIVFLKLAGNIQFESWCIEKYLCLVYRKLHVYAHISSSPRTAIGQENTFPYKPRTAIRQDNTFPCHQEQLFFEGDLSGGWVHMK